MALNGPPMLPGLSDYGALSETSLFVFWPKTFDIDKTLIFQFVWFLQILKIILDLCPSEFCFLAFIMFHMSQEIM